MKRPKSYITDAFFWLFINLNFLLIRTLGMLVRFVPYKVQLITVLGTIFGITLLLLHYYEWKSVVSFARSSKSKTKPWVYVVKYFIQKGKNIIWGAVYPEAPDVLCKYIAINNKAGVEEALRLKKGVILLGAHYGPTLSSFLLNEMKIDTVSLIGSQNSNNINRKIRAGISHLITKKIAFLGDAKKVKVAKKFEKGFVQHLREGGAIFMMLDVPRQKSGGFITDFFDRQIEFDYFPFKLALKYDVPVFFYFFESSNDAAFNLRFIRIDKFKTIEDGARKYFKFCQHLIEKNPYMWNSLPRFIKWPSPKK